MKKLNIVYEDKEIIIINKPSKMLTISTDKKFERNLYSEVREYVKKKYPKNKIFIVHRLDKDTSGLIVFAKNENAKYFLQNNWDKFIKKYYAVVEGEVSERKKLLENYLAETKTLQVYITKDKRIGKLAKTSYEVIRNKGKYSLLDIQIFTGRKNQIRVQLSNINNPIVGDKKFGSKVNPVGRMLLHAYYLKLIHPGTKKEMEFETSLPKEFEKII